MITEVPLEQASDRRHCETNKGALVRVEPSARFNQPSAGDLHQVLVVFAAMHEAAGQRFGQP
jgi:hypothetical protein